MQRAGARADAQAVATQALAHLPSRKRGEEGAGQGLLQCRKQRKTLFFQRGEGTSKATNIPGALPTAKTARHVLLNLDHANIALGLRMVKGHVQVHQESLHGVFAFDEASEEIAGSALFAASAPGFACGLRWGRSGQFTELDHLTGADFRLRNDLLFETILACLPGLIGNLFPSSTRVGIDLAQGCPVVSSMTIRSRNR